MFDDNRRVLRPKAALPVGGITSVEFFAQEDGDVTGCLTGDTLLHLVGGFNLIPVVPSGWTEIAGFAAASNYSNIDLNAAYKVRTSDGTEPMVDWTDQADTRTFGIIRVRGGVYHSYASEPTPGSNDPYVAPALTGLPDGSAFVICRSIQSAVDESYITYPDCTVLWDTGPNTFRNVQLYDTFGTGYPGHSFSAEGLNRNQVFSTFGFNPA